MIQGNTTRVAMVHLQAESHSTGLKPAPLPRHQSEHHHHDQMVQMWEVQYNVNLLVLPCMEFSFSIIGRTTGFYFDWIFLGFGWVIRKPFSFQIAWLAAEENGNAAPATSAHASQQPQHRVL